MTLPFRRRRCSPWRPVRPAPAGRWITPVLRTEGRAAMIDGVLAAAVLLGLVLNAGQGWWPASCSPGVSIKELAEYLGHSDPAFTLRVYAHMLP